MGRNATGVIAIKLKEDDTVVAMDLAEEGKSLLVVSEHGYGKRTSLDEYKTQKRAGMGLRTYNVKDKTGKLVSAKVIDEKDEIMMISALGTIIRIKAEDISLMGRNTQGVKSMKVDKEEDRVMAIAKFVEEE